MKRILVLGGTRFFGKKLVQLLLKEGHEVTIATRGKTTDPFGEQVNRLLVDREDYQSLKEVVGTNEWDIVYDNICFSPQEATDACEIFSGKVKHYILTSTLSVYNMGNDNINEDDFNPYNYPIKLGSKSDFLYGEAKRLAEAVFFQTANFPVSAVRFPIVLGMDDYTKRLHFHIDSVKNRKPIGMPNKEARMSFITSDEAAKFLKWIGNHPLGPINACSKGDLSLSEILSIIEEAVGQAAIVETETHEEQMSPFGIPASWCMNTSKAEQAGYNFESINSWFPELVREMARDIR